MWLAFISTPQKRAWCCASMRRAKYRPWTGLSRDCRSKKGRCGTFTHDYVRHGTTTLFAALEILEGKVIGQCFPRHRHQEFLKFLRLLDDEFPEKLKLHLVLDNYGTHKHPKVQSWLKRHPRFTVHFIPTSSSWLNQVERWFGE